jgi:hypothetical protein
VNKASWLWLAIFLPLAAVGQEPIHSSTVTLGVGGLPYSNGYDYIDGHGGPSFTGRYEFRLWKYVALEGGVDTLLPSIHTSELLPVISVLSGQNLVSYFSGCTACVIVPISDRTRITLLPFGLKGILPVAGGRVELFGGIGGAYAWHSDYGSYRNGWLGQASLGGRIALDRGRHFWLGTSPRAYSNLHNSREFSVNGQRPNTNTFRIDGMNGNTGLGISATPGTYAGSSLPGMTVIGSTQSMASKEEIERVELRSSEFAPEHGDRPGAQIEVETRSGLPDFHGSVFGYVRQRLLDSPDWFAQ